MHHLIRSGDKKDLVTRIQISVSEDASIPEMLEAFKYYLLACGYVFDGELDIVNDSEQSDDDLV